MKRVGGCLAEGLLKEYSRLKRPDDPMGLTSYPASRHPSSSPAARCTASARRTPPAASTAFQEYSPGLALSPVTRRVSARSMRFLASRQPVTQTSASAAFAAT